MEIGWGGGGESVFREEKASITSTWWGIFLGFFSKTKEIGWWGVGAVESSTDALLHKIALRIGETQLGVFEPSPIISFSVKLD